MGVHVTFSSHLQSCQNWFFQDFIFLCRFFHFGSRRKPSPTLKIRRRNSISSDTNSQVAESVAGQHSYSTGNLRELEMKAPPCRWVCGDKVGLRTVVTNERYCAGKHFCRDIAGEAFSVLSELCLEFVKVSKNLYLRYSVFPQPYCEHVAVKLVKRSG